MYFVSMGELWWDEALLSQGAGRTVSRGNERCVAPAPTRVGPASEGLSFCYADDGVMLKRGPTAAVRRWWEDKHDEYRNVMSVDLVIVDVPGDAAGCDLLNRIVANTTLLASMINRGELPTANRYDDGVSPSP